MKAIKRITALALCALMLLGLLSGCGEKKQGDEKFVLNVSVCNVIDSLDPAMNTDTDADSVFYALYENLMRESDDGSGEVTLTTAWPRSTPKRQTTTAGDLPLHAALHCALVGRGKGDGG